MLFSVCMDCIVEGVEETEAEGDEKATHKFDGAVARRSEVIT